MSHADRRCGHCYVLGHTSPTCPHKHLSRVESMAQSPEGRHRLDYERMGFISTIARVLGGVPREEWTYYLLRGIEKAGGSVDAAVLMLLRRQLEETEAHVAWCHGAQVEAKEKTTPATAWNRPKAVA